MEKIFRLKDHNTDVRTEIIAGLTTFMTMAYVLAVQPSAIVGFGDAAYIVDCNGVVISKSAILIMCALISGLITLLMAFYANMPFALSTGMGTNFLLGAIFAFVAGTVYQSFQKKKTRKGAIIGSVLGALAMALLSVPLNYYLTYPIYSKFMPIDVIVGMYQAIRPSANGLLECLITFNMPFTFVKGMLDVVLCFLIYKPLSPILHK